MIRPLDFVIIGAQKAGTTALSQFLAAHPELALAKGKEVHLFSQHPESLAWDVAQINQFYHPYFDEPSPNKLCGEATPIYLYWPPIIPALKRYNSRLKVIVLLRDPVDRAISHHQMELSRGNERLPLWLALLLEPYRLWRCGSILNHAQRCYSYAARGLYARQLSRLREHFPDEQILILENSELQKHHQETLNRVFQFLGVSPLNIAPQRVFEGEYKKSTAVLYMAIVKFILRWRFRRPNKKLKELLLAMNIQANWSWLN